MSTTPALTALQRDESFGDHFFQPCTAHRGIERASEAVWYGASPQDVPCLPLAAVHSKVFASHSGPDLGIADPANTGSIKSATTAAKTQKDSLLTLLDNSSKAGLIAGCTCWSQCNRKACGGCITLYDQNPLTKRITGDPIADCFAVCARSNCGLLGVADGVNWGEKSKLAARAGLFACFRYINQHLSLTDCLTDTRRALSLIMEGFSSAHKHILNVEGGLTTLCVALAVPLRDLSPQFAVCVVNLGDSLAFLWSKSRGVREVTIGSHDVWTERNIRDAGGALGPVHGTEPELNNLTCSLSICDPGDLLFITSDGVSDNFDPVVQRIALSNPLLSDTNSEDVNHLKPCLKPGERHHYSVKEMERVLLESELSSGYPPSAQELCASFLSNVSRLTQAKRDILEDPGIHIRDANHPSRKPSRGRRDTVVVERLSLAPGKLDHACVVAYEVGVYRGNQWEAYEETATFRPSNQTLSRDLSDSGCGSDHRSSSLSERRHSSSFAPDFLSDIEFADSDSDCVIEQ